MERRQISGRESIWEYPKTPVIRPAARHVRVIHDGICVARTDRPIQMCEMGHPPTYYIPPEDVRVELLEPNDHQTFCEWKGIAHHLDLTVGTTRVEDIAWYYPEPNRDYDSICDFIAFYPDRLDTCLVDGEEAAPEPNPFYGGWITSDILGPFER